MERIDWNEAPEWADRVIKGGASDLLYWASENTLQPVKGGASFVTSTHIRDGLPVVERRPEFVPDKPLTSFSWSCNAEPAPITIEQRIASLRALEKQVEEARAELTRDFESLGLTWPVRDEPIITDWRDLRVGDVIELTGSTNKSWEKHSGQEMIVKNVFPNHEDDDSQVDLYGKNGLWSLGGNTTWRFIRRP